MIRTEFAHSQCGRAEQRGVTLIELMIGMLIGMLAILVISQVLLVSEGQKRTTAAGSDSQVNGALSLYAVQRDIQTAGYGFTSSPAIVGCPINAQFGGAAIASFPALPTAQTPLAPVIITREANRVPAGVGDSIRMLASSKTSYSVPTRVIPPGILVNGLSVPVTASLGFAQGDLALLAADGVQPCWVFQVTAVPTAMDVPRADNGAGWNTAGTPTQAYNDGNILVNLGTLVDNRYEINVVNNVNELQLSSFDSANPGTRITRNIQSDIVNLRAYYGRDTSGDGIVDVYDTATPTTNAGWLGVRSIRLIVVSRSSQYEKDPVTTANPVWEVGTTPPTTATPGVVPADVAVCPSGGSACLTIDVGAGVAGDVDAKHYRYKIFETIVPLRNMLWRS